MSDVSEKEPLKFYFYPNPVVKWDACTINGVDIPEGEVEIESTITGRFDLWQVPKCDANPDGLWANLFNGQFYEGVEPGCESWDKHLLAKISFQGSRHPTGRSDAEDQHDNKHNVGFDYVDDNFLRFIHVDLLQPAPIELPVLEDKTIRAKSGTYADLGIEFTGDTVGSWTLNIQPADCSVSGLTGAPDTVIHNGETKVITGTREELNEELKNAQVLVGETTGGIVLTWDHDTTATLHIVPQEA